MIGVLSLLFPGFLNDRADTLGYGPAAGNSAE